MRGRVSAVSPPLCAIASTRAMVVSRRSEAALSRTVASSQARVAALSRSGAPAASAGARAMQSTVWRRRTEARWSCAAASASHSDA